MGDIRFEARKARLTVTDMIASLWDEPVPMLATDVSPAGIFIPTDLLLEPGEVVVACFHLPGHKQEFELFGEVAWISMPRRAEDEQGPAGMGVEFVKTRPIERLAIRDSLHRFPRPLPYKVKATHLAA